MKNTKDALMKHLNVQDYYSLIRLRECFLYERKIRPENKDNIQEILDVIEELIVQKEAKNVN